MVEKEGEASDQVRDAPKRKIMYEKKKSQTTQSWADPWGKSHYFCFEIVPFFPFFPPFFLFVSIISRESPPFPPGPAVISTVRCLATVHFLIQNISMTSHSHNVQHRSIQIFLVFFGTRWTFLWYLCIQWFYLWRFVFHRQRQTGTTGLWNDIPTKSNI